MEKFEDTAKEYALRMHEGQEHGCLAMSGHLTAVTNKLREKTNEMIANGDLTEYVQDKLMAVGWLHDIVEDTPVSVDDIRQLFDDWIAERVNDVTDGLGNNRLERHLNTYWRIRRQPLSVLVKMCDRWHNQDRSLANNEMKYIKNYMEEYLYFKFALYKPGLYPKFWEELDNQYVLMKMALDIPYIPNDKGVI